MMCLTRRGRLFTFPFFLLGNLILFAGAGYINYQLSVQKVLYYRYLPGVEVLKKASLGHQHTTSDYYFLNAIQYFGDSRNRDEEFRWLYPMLKIVTELDPQYGTPYRWGGVVLPLFNGKEWVNVKEANELLGKGIRDVSKEDERYWQLPFYVGYNAMTYAKDYRKAGDNMALASRYVKGNVYPRYLALLATRLYASAGDPEAGMKFAEEAFMAEGDPDIKKELDKRIKELRVERDLKMLDSAIKKFRDRFSKGPWSLRELVEKRVLYSIPKEPFGGEYFIIGGEARSSTYKQQLKIHPFPRR